MADAWPVLYVAGLGAFHGLNPAMGWLFAAALGLHHHRRTTVLASLVPIAIGHALSIAVVATLLVTAGFLVPGSMVRLAAAIALAAWAAYHWRFGKRHQLHFGMQAGLLGLAGWSFLMATAHGAGVMLWPALMPSCLPAGASMGWDAPLAAAVLVVGVHTAAMLATMALMATAAHRWAGSLAARAAWIGLDCLWTLALAAMAVVLLAY